MVDLIDHLPAIPAEGETLLLELVERIERARGLRDDESALVEAIVRRERRRTTRRYHTWTHKDDAALLKAARTARGVGELATRMGLSRDAVWSRLRHLRNLPKGTARRNSVKE